MKFINNYNLKEYKLDGGICPDCGVKMNWNRYKDLYVSNENDDIDDISFKLEIYICPECRTKYINRY